MIFNLWSDLDTLQLYLFGPGSSVCIATDYGLDGPGSTPRGDEIFRPSRPVLGAHPASCKMGTGSFPGVKCDRGVHPQNQSEFVGLLIYSVIKKDRLN